MHSSFYERVVPPQFSAPDDDRLMWSLCQKFAVEGNTDEEPNGHYYLTPKGMERVAREVITTHFGWTGSKREMYLRDNLPKVWAYHDILNEGFVDVAKGPVILKSLLGSTELNNGLQLQVGEENMPAAKQSPLSLHQYRPDPELQPWAAKPSAAELNKKKSKIDKAFSPQKGAHFGYERVVPPQYAQASDDRLMHSLITQYALEGNTGGQPNGHFYMTRDASMRACDEVVDTHYGFKGQQKHQMV